MVRDDRLRPLEPERRQLREHLALVGNARAEHVVEGRDAVGGDEQQRVAKVEDVADLAVTLRGESVQTRFEEGSSERQRDVPERKAASYRCDRDDRNRTQQYRLFSSTSLIYCGFPRE